MWWLRRRLSETTVHRADAAIALGRGYSLSPELAVEGISEHLERVALTAGAMISTLDGLVKAPVPVGPGQTFRLEAFDVPAVWTVVRDGEGVILSGDRRAEATAALRGPAVDLLLGVTRRRVFAD
ncbi:hypothetical protein AB0J83_03695 [Actinoplanes sp. NPDC049596]|uniref:hypothetical protein n=1 Tax=unclassified Actinoplanes TaxID=2626549 RepID=UPI0034299C5C